MKPQITHIHLLMVWSLDISRQEPLSPGTGEREQRDYAAFWLALPPAFRFALMISRLMRRALWWVHS
jgi:hypothetical protein